MNQTSTNGAGLLSALLTPRNNYAAASAARNEALQLGMYNAQLQEQKALETRQADTAQQEYLTRLNSLPFLGRDVQKASTYMNQEKAQLEKRIRDDYQGDIRKWHAVEGQAWMSNAANRLKQQPFYQQATRNLQNVLTAQEARQKGEYLVGVVTPNGLHTGEQRLQDFLAGKTDTFENLGSYKPEDDLKEIRSQYAPGVKPWLPTLATEEAKQAHLINRYGLQVGMDKYLRQHQNVPTFYKTDPITDMYKFQMEQGRYGMEQGRYGMQKQAFGTSESLKRKQGQLLDLKIKEKQSEMSGGNGLPFDFDLLAHPDTVIKIGHDPSAPKKLANGYDLSQLNSLAGTTLYDNGDEVLARKLGLSKGKDGFLGGNITSGFTTANGTHAVNLKGSNFSVVGIEPKAWYDPREVVGGALNKGSVNGFAKVTLQFKSPYDAERAGLYDPNRVWGGEDATSMFDSTTKMGTGVYNPTTKQATIYIPAGPFDKQFFKALQKGSMGQKSRNESASDPDYVYTNTSTF